MVGVSFGRTTVVKDEKELKKVINKHTLQNGHEIRRQVETLIAKNNNRHSIERDKRESIR